MHNIVERPVAINGKVEIRPIMYVALSNNAILPLLTNATLASAAYDV
jgi:hypothetical protein